MIKEIHRNRRKFLIHALGIGLFTTGSATNLIQPAFALGGLSRKLPPGRSIYKLQGSVFVDGIQANIDSQVKANSLIKTGASSKIIFVVGSDAFILRSQGTLQLEGENFLIDSMRLLTGKLLSVFGKRTKPHNIQTHTATIGIRGTGIYIESEPQQSYVCTCYGHTVLAAADKPSEQIEIKTKHHDKPFYIYPSNSEKIFQPAPVINHSDVELELIEQLVGRKTPFDPFEYGNNY